MPIAPSRLFKTVSMTSDWMRWELVCPQQFNAVLRQIFLIQFFAALGVLDIVVDVSDFIRELHYFAFKRLGLAGRFDGLRCHL